MQTPTARLLELLELLQTRPLTTGREIAEHLEIDGRTVRVTSPRCRTWTSRSRAARGRRRVPRPAGYRLPPLMLSDDEAVVVVLGLIAARRQGLDSGEGAADGRLTKIHRVLPDLLRRRVEALETALGFTASPRAGAPVAGDTVLVLGRRRAPTAPRPDRIPAPTRASEPGAS
jgi:predicted DNA-binding transcriptional regulator YafY